MALARLRRVPLDITFDELRGVVDTRFRGTVTMDEFFEAGHWALEAESRGAAVYVQDVAEVANLSEWAEWSLGVDEWRKQANKDAQRFVVAGRHGATNALLAEVARLYGDDGLSWEVVGSRDEAWRSAGIQATGPSPRAWFRIERRFWIVERRGDDKETIEVTLHQDAAFDDSTRWTAIYEWIGGAAPARVVMDARRLRRVPEPAELQAQITGVSSQRESADALGAVAMVGPSGATWPKAWEALMGRRGVRASGFTDMAAAREWLDVQ